MSVTKDKAAPYAPASAIIGLIERSRTRGLPTPVTSDVLSRAGISGSLIPRTFQALQVLDLIDETGQPTAIFESIRKAPGGEYKQRLVEWLNGAYADALNFVDPATADDVAARDAFRSYTPIGQQARMVSLFVGLYAAAGVGAEKASAPRASTSRPKQPATSRPPAKPLGIKPAVRKTIVDSSELPVPLTALLSRLPQEGQGWTQAGRDKFVHTFSTLLDFCFPIIEAELSVMESEGEEE